MSVPAGTRVKWCDRDNGRLQPGDLGTVTGSNDYSVYVLMDNPKGQNLSRHGSLGIDYHWSGSISDECFIVVPNTFTTGAQVILTSDTNGHSLPLNVPHTIVRPEDSSEYTFLIAEGTGAVTGQEPWTASGDRGRAVRRVRKDVMTLVDGGTPAVTTTLEGFKVFFLEGALERGRLNGYNHEQQVKDALAVLAGLEYLEPSKTLEDFQKRVVTLAMEKKGEYSWCGEPEAYLEEIGLGHLLPQRKTLTVIMEVDVSAPAGTGVHEWRRLAREAAARQVNEYPLDFGSIPNGERTVTNSLRD